MEIRKAEFSDLKRIQELNLMLFEKEKGEYDEMLDLGWTFGKEGTKYFEGSLSKEGSCTFVVEENSEIIGYLIGSRSKVVGYRNIKSRGELDNMFVLEEYRGKGVGSLLYEAFLSWCRSEGFEMIRVTALTGNEKALEFYRNKGLKDYNLTLEGEL